MTIANNSNKSAHKVQSLSSFSTIPSYIWEIEADQ